MATQTRRPVTPHRLVESVMGGYFPRQGRAYDNWRPHGSDDWLLLYTVEGAGLITHHRLAMPLLPGEAVLFRPGEPQDYRTEPHVGSWSLRWAHFRPRPHWRAWLRWPRPADGPGRLRVNAPEIRSGIVSALARLVSLSRRGWAGTDDLRMNALEEALLWFDLSARAHDRWTIDERVRLAMDYLAAHTERPFALAPLARHCGLSVSRLSHLFKEETGVTLQQYGEEVRLREAQQLLTHTSLPTKEIAAAVGFEDPYYFSKRFRRFAGSAPSHWRARRDSNPRPPA